MRDIKREMTAPVKPKPKAEPAAAPENDPTKTKEPEAKSSDG